LARPVADPPDGIRHGRDAVVGFFEGIASTTDVREFDVKTIASTDNEVLAFLRSGFSPTGSDEVTSMNLHHYFRFDDAGRVAYYRGSEDTQLVAATLAGQPALSTSLPTS